jgi:S1-C subfamily serine protease
VNSSRDAITFHPGNYASNRLRILDDAGQELRAAVHHLLHDHATSDPGCRRTDGLLVREVEDDSPAARAGIAEGDLIVAAGGREVTSADDLFDVLGSLAADAPLEIVLVRGTDERAVTVAP